MQLNFIHGITPTLAIPLNSALSSTLFSLSLSPPSLLTSILRYDPHISPHIFALPKIRRLPKFLFFPSPPFLHSISRNFKARRDNPAVRSLLILSILLFFLPFLQTRSNPCKGGPKCGYPRKTRISLPQVKNFIVGIFSKNSRSSRKAVFLWKRPYAE